MLNVYYKFFRVKYILHKTFTYFYLLLIKFKEVLLSSSANLLAFDVFGFLLSVSIRLQTATNFFITWLHFDKSLSILN